MDNGTGKGNGKETGSDMDVDSTSDTTSTCSESSSILLEFEQLFAEFEAIQKTHDLAINQLQTVASLLNETNTMKIAVDGNERDFYDVIDEIHSDETGVSIGKKLLALIDSAEFYVR